MYALCQLDSCHACHSLMLVVHVSTRMQLDLVMHVSTRMQLDHVMYLVCH